MIGSTSARALLVWINSTTVVDSPIEHLAELNDGAVLARLLYDASPKYFASVHDPSGTGLAQDRSLPERIWSSVLAYIEDVLYFSTASLPSRLNFRATDEKVKRETNTAIEQNYDSIVTLVELVLFVATLGETRYHYLDGIDRLEKAVLEELLESIQRMKRQLGSNCTLLVDYFTKTAERIPSSLALQFDDASYTYSQLYHLSRYLAHQIVACDEFKVGTVIYLCLDKSVEMVVAMLAVLIAGGGYVNLDRSIPLTRKEKIVGELIDRGKIAIVEESEFKSWSNSTTLSSLQPLNPIRILSPLVNAISANSTVDLEQDFPLSPTFLRPPSPNDVAYVVYTSGSTGNPKGIIVEHQSVVAFLHNYRGVFGRGEGERVLQFPSYSFDVIVVNIFDTFAHGATLCMTTTSSLLSDLAGAALRLDVTLVDLTPTVSSLLLEYDDAKPLNGESIREAWDRAGFRIKVLSTGGEKVEKWVVDAWTERGVRVVIDYGPSETSVGVISNQRTASVRSSVVPIGKPMGNNLIVLLDEGMNEVDDSMRGEGEICVGGMQVTRGYVNEDLNEGVFITHSKLGRLYRTGDIGRWLENGYIEYLGRRDGQVKLNGLRIEVGEIEAHLNSTTSSFLRRGIVMKYDTFLVGFLEFGPGSPFSSTSADHPSILPFYSDAAYSKYIDDEIKPALARSLPPWMIPRYFIPIDNIPIAGMGKADRKLLRSLLVAFEFRPSATSNGVIRIDDKAHRVVRNAWSKVLKVEEDSIEDKDSFTRLGGDSIGLMRVISLLRRDYSLAYSDIVAASTLHDFAEIIRQSSPSAESTSPLEYRPFSLIDAPILDDILEELETEVSILRSDIEDIYPTSPSQDMLLAGSLDSSHYYAQAVYNIDSSISSETLSAALEELVRRYEVLRTCFYVVDSIGTIQVVLDAGSQQVRECVKCEVVETGSQELDLAISDWLDYDRHSHSFQWGRLALAFRIFSDDKGERRLCWCMHHAMSDGWTLELLTTDLRALCHKLPLLDRPPFSSLVSHSTSLSSTHPAALEYWSHYLRLFDSPVWPSVPLHSLSTTSTASLHYEGGNDLLTFSPRSGFTLAIATRVALFVAIAQYSRCSDVVIGVVRSGRDIDLMGADEIIGPLVSVLPSRLLVSSSASLLDLLHQESTSDRQSRIHQQITLATIGKLMEFETRLNLFSILFTYQSLADRTASSNESSAYPIRQPPRSIRMPTGYALSFEVTPRNESGLELSCYFDERVMGVDDVTKVLTTMRTVIDVILRIPETTIGELLVVKEGTMLSSRSVDARNARVKTVVDQRILGIVTRIWADVLKIRVDEVDIERSFSSQGGDSISMMRLSVRLKKEDLSIPMSLLVPLSTVLAQVGFLSSQ